MLVNLKNTQTTASAKLLPDGTYGFICVEAKLKPTKNGSGQYIEITLQCTTDGEELNKKVWHRFNIKNASEKAQEIGLQQLKNYLEAAGRPTDVLESEAELVATKVKAIVRTEKKEPYDASNIIKKFLKINSVVELTAPTEDIPF